MAVDVQDWTKATALPPQLVDTRVVPGGVSTTFSVPPPPGIRGLVFACSDIGGFINLQSVVGHQSGVYYWAAGISWGWVFTGPELFVPFASDLGSDTSLDVTVASGTSTGPVLKTWAVFDALTFQPAVGPGQAWVAQRHVNADADATLTVAPPGGVKASGTLGADTAGRKYHCHAYYCDFAATTAVAQYTFVRIHNGASGSPTVLHQRFCGVQASIGAIDHAVAESVDVVGGFGVAMTLEFDAGNAGLQETVNLSGYLA